MGLFEFFLLTWVPLFFVGYWLLYLITKDDSDGYSFYEAVEDVKELNKQMEKANRIRAKIAKDKTGYCK